MACHNNKHFSVENLCVILYWHKLILTYWTHAFTASCNRNAFLLNSVFYFRSCFIVLGWWNITVLMLLACVLYMSTLSLYILLFPLHILLSPLYILFYLLNFALPFTFYFFIYQLTLPLTFESPFYIFLYSFLYILLSPLTPWINTSCPSHYCHITHRVGGIIISFFFFFGLQT